ncbi:MAG: D-sedoheptulose 7-phosphate isomerase [Bacteroidota bacterium]
MEERIRKIIAKSIEVKASVLLDAVMIATVEVIVNEIVTCYQNGGKVLFCGNGGSAADAQHLAAELSGRFYFDRQPLNAEALHVNSSFVTAVANDYGYDAIFARMIKAVGKSGDILIGLTTSGNSQNILNAFDVAKSLEMKTIGFTGDSGGKLKEKSDFLLNIPSSDTPRIQESHIMLGHIICELVEEKLFKF